jgi:hypothetical protein
MTLVLLIVISMMWFPVGLFFLGTGDSKTCGMVTFCAAILVGIGGIVQGAPPTSNFWDAAILICFSLLYLVIAHALLWGVENMKSVGNTSLMLAVLCAIYTIVNLTGSAPTALAKVPRTPYLAFMFATFTVLLVLVWGNSYGKISGKTVGASLIILNFLCLVLPAVGLLAYGWLPF